MIIMRKIKFYAAIIGLVFALQGCTVTKFFGYKMRPDFPVFEDNATIQLAALQADVDVAVRPDGVYQVEADNEADAASVLGYLMARDRLFQMDLFRHAARGELAAFIGNQQLGSKTALQVDKFNRFIGHLDSAQKMLDGIESEDLKVLEAFAAGVNFWIDNGQTSIEHRLLDSTAKQWKPLDTFVIFRLVMFGMTHNYTRELRRLLIACDGGWDVLKRVWPTGIEFPEHILPDENLSKEKFTVPVSIVPEMREHLLSMCASVDSSNDSDTALVEPAARGPLSKSITTLARSVMAFSDGIEASNNWVISGEHTASGKPILANDPHLPLISPPIVWAAETSIDEHKTAGFYMPGIPVMVFGSNLNTAWGLTINNVDLQDLYVEKTLDEQTYMYEGQPQEFEVRQQTFQIKGGDPVELSARFSRHGVVLNDLDPFLEKGTPIVSLRGLLPENFQDTAAFRRLPYVKNTRDLFNQIQPMDSACLNWVFADQDGDIGWASPCRVPKRMGWRGDFPVPGWISKYEWQGHYKKSELPRSLNPKRGWLNTSNNRVLPANRFPTPYDNDPSTPNRFIRVAEVISSITRHTIADSAALQIDTKITFWNAIRKQIAPLCADPDQHKNDLIRRAWIELCAWDGFMDSASIGATLYIHLSNALADRTLAEELTGGASSDLWTFLQSIPHFEGDLDRLWAEPLTAEVWDLKHTQLVEDKVDTIAVAVADAIELVIARYGDDPNDWAWGTARPFFIQHAFGAKGGMAGNLFNTPTMPGLGAPNTVFKHQFYRVDREKLHPGAGAAVHLIVELTGPKGARYALAGGQSGWPKSPHYGDQLEMWQHGETYPLWTSEWDPGTLQYVKFTAD